MKKILLIILSLIIICFLLPIILTKQFKTTQTIAETAVIKENTVNETECIITFDYKKYNTVKLLHTKTDEVEEIALDEYLYGVVASEMPANFEIEALKAQAVVARTYTIYKIVNSNKHDNANICDDSACCQAWISKEERFAKWSETERDSNWNKIVEAVNSTQGKIITYNNEPINAFFHANSGGTTETVINVWGGQNYPYLQTVQTIRRRCICTISIRSNIKQR